MRTAICMLMIATAARAGFAPSNTVTRDLSDEVSRTRIAFKQRSARDQYFRFVYDSTAKDLSNADSVVLTYAPSSGAWSQSITGSVFNGGNGVVLIPFTTSNTDTNGVFEFDLTVGSNTTTWIDMFGHIELYERAGSDASGTFPTDSAIDLTAYTFTGEFPSANLDDDLGTLADPTAWRLFYANGSSVITELAFGTSNQVLTSQGASAAPTWAASSSSYTNLFTGAATTGSVTSTAGDTSKFLRGDGTWQAIAGGGDLFAANNLSDLDSAAAGRTNLGVVAGGAGDIWVEKAGDTMSGDLDMGTNDIWRAYYVGYGSSVVAGSPVVNVYEGKLQYGSTVYLQWVNKTLDQGVWSMAYDATSGNHLLRRSYADSRYVTNDQPNSVTSAMITNDTIDSADYAAGSIDQEHLAADIIGTNEMEDVDHGDVSWSGGVASLDGDVVDSAEIADDAVDSEHYAADIPGGTAGSHSFDFGDVSTFVLATNNNPTTGDQGEMVWDSNDYALEAYGDSTSGIIPLMQTAQITVFDPDTIQSTEDAVPMLAVEAEWAPHGITIMDCGFKTDDTNSYTLVFEEWTSPGDGSPSTIESVAQTADTYEGEDDGTMSDGNVAAGSIVYVDLPTTDKNMLQAWITYYITEGN